MKWNIEPTQPSPEFEGRSDIHAFCVRNNSGDRLVMNYTDDRIGYALRGNVVAFADSLIEEEKQEFDAYDYLYVLHPKREHRDGIKAELTSYFREYIPAKN